MDAEPIRLTGAEEVAWNLADLYAGLDDAALSRDLDEADARAAKLRDGYYGRIAGMDATGLLEMLREYEAIVELSSKVGSYAHLAWAADTGDPARGALLQRVTERDSRLSQELVFVELEWAQAPDDVAMRLLGSPELAGYHHFLEKARRYRPHLLIEAEERILAEKSVTGRSAWTRFFDETLSAARYDLGGEKVLLTRVLNRLYATDRDERRGAAASVTAGLREMSRTTTYVFNNLLADKASDDRLRHYPTWISARNLGNEVDDATVEALIAAVTSRYDIVARYYGLKRRLLGLDELHDYDRYAPLPAADRHYTWDEGRQVVLSAYGGFHPRLAEVAARFFDEHWIDAAIRPGKRSGAFSAGTVPSVHPYILVNYEARPRDVMTVAHELGHGVHQYLSRDRGMLQMHTPLTTAETASVFGEMLVFQALTAAESDPKVVLAMLTSKIEDSFATVFRQVSMNRFEHAIHTARRDEGELTTQRLSDLWLQTQQAMFADSVTLTPDYGIWWSYVHHFTSVPGYVYAYAFGELLVLALYARYLEVGPDFAEGYLRMLAAGGSDWPRQIVSPLGVDLEEPGFWDKGLSILDGMVQRAERLAGE
ncbi:MAG: M3 family oligoendopeptidase [Anaerolineae bacterium]